MYGDWKCPYKVSVFPGMVGGVKVVGTHVVITMWNRRHWYFARGKVESPPAPAISGDNAIRRPPSACPADRSVAAAPNDSGRGAQPTCRGTSHRGRTRPPLYLPRARSPPWPSSVFAWRRRRRRRRYHTGHERFTHIRVYGDRKSQNIIYFKRGRITSVFYVYTLSDRVPTPVGRSLHLSEPLMDHTWQQ